MKNLKSKELIAYASSFVSFVLPKIDAEEIVLYGSAARGEAEKESDVDLFFNVREIKDFSEHPKVQRKTQGLFDVKNPKKEEEIKRTIKNELEKFYKSKIAEIWALKGIKNPIKFEIGNLEKWKLKRSIISDGIVLYGRYKELPEKTNGFVYFNLKPIKKITKRNRVLRNLFGREEKNYSSEGILSKTGGKKLSALSFIAPLGKTEEIFKLLNSEKIDYSFFEFWSDEIAS